MLFSKKADAFRRNFLLGLFGRVFFIPLLAREGFFMRVFLVIQRSLNHKKMSCGNQNFKMTANRTFRFKGLVMQRFLLLVGLILFSSVANAGERIIDVDFLGLESISETSARANIQSIEGSELSRQILGNDIKKLYKTGFFQDVQVEKSAVAGGVKLTFIVQEKKIVGKLSIEGNKKIRTPDIEAVLQIREFENYDSARIAQTRNKILSLYEDKGYFLADVDVVTEPFDDDQNQVELIFKIHEGRAVKVRRIDFLGNSVFSDKELRKVIRTREKTGFSFLSGAGKLEDENLKIDLKLLSYYYQDHGFIDVVVGEPQVTLTRDKQSIVIAIPLVEGQQYHVSSLDVTGDILTTKEELKAAFKQKVGDIYKKSLEFADHATVERIYGDQAYINVDFAPQVLTNPATREAFVTYSIRKNAKVKIDKIIIKGNDVTHDKVIRRELRILENAYISQSGLERSRDRLLQLGYFKEVNISTPNSIEPNKVNVIIEVVENNTGDFNVSGGFSTLESFVFSARLRKDNLFGRGLSTSASFSISQLRQDFQVYYRDWYFLDSKWSLILNGFSYVSALNPNYDQRQIGGMLGFGREIFDFFRTDLEYSFSDVRVNNFSSQVPQFFRENANGVISSLGTTISYDRRDNRIVPKKGYFSSLNFSYADEWLGTESPFTKTIFDNRIFIPLPLKMVFRSRQVVGYVNSLNSDPVSLTNRFYMGGPDTLRGYNLQSVGPNISVPRAAKGQDSNYAYGGDKKLQMNLELEIPIFQQAGLYGVTFFDSGNAFAETENYSLTDLRHNYGFGVRWQSPIGPLRFEWGFPIDRRSGEDSMVFNFMIGPNF